MAVVRDGGIVCTVEGWTHGQTRIWIEEVFSMDKLDPVSQKIQLIYGKSKKITPRFTNLLTAALLKQMHTSSLPCLQRNRRYLIISEQTHTSSLSRLHATADI